MKRPILLCMLVVSVWSFQDFNEVVREFKQREPLKDGGKHWALLAAGSSGYSNYRHQADICHAYQILHTHGIPDEQIVVMMHDDIAENKQNPVKGNIINRPNGTNVYVGVPKDYTAFEVSPGTFMHVLKGESDKVRGKVIDSGPNDNIFVNFVDHGAPGLLSFGLFSLRARELRDTIQYLHDNQRYKNLVFYVEACEAGSMFYNLLPDNMNVYATTASSPHESSYACYFDPTRQTYLGDVYSIKWMQDSDKEDVNTETLHEQYTVTQQETNTSHVQQYGDLSMGQMTVVEFQGMQVADDTAPPVGPCEDAVKSEDVPLEILRRRLDLVQSKEEMLDIEVQLAELLEERDITDKVVKQIVTIATEDDVTARRMMESRMFISQWDCYEAVLDSLEENCHDQLNIPQNFFHMRRIAGTERTTYKIDSGDPQVIHNDYALRKLYMFVNMCESNIPLETIHSAIDKVCNDEEI